MDNRTPENGLDFFFITNVPELAGYVEQYGVRYVMVDLETHGKSERQAGYDTLISAHTVDDVARVKAALTQAELVVRVNPLHEDSLREIDTCLDAGADLLMLPMFRTAAVVDRFCELVAGRVDVIPLVETVAAMHELPRIVRLNGLRRIHIGLNDLHLDLGMNFMFQPMADGKVEAMAEQCHRVNVPFGVGGVSLVGHGHVPGESVLGEHARLGSTAVILSRTFHQRAESLAELQQKIDFPAEVNKLRNEFQRHLARSPETISSDQQQFQHRVAQVATRAA